MLFLLLLGVLVIGAIGTLLLFRWRNLRVDRKYRDLMRPKHDMAKLQALIGNKGICRASCRPFGEVKIDRELYVARAETLVEAGTCVRVMNVIIRKAGPLLEVESADAH